jgi:glyoxylase-like metal-dependent hydrolase (beta-lactamase superfamily II)
MDRSFSRRDGMKLLGAGAMASLFAPALARAESPTAPVAADPQLQGAGIYKMKIGAIDVTLLSDGGFPMDPSAFFPKQDAASVEAAAKDAFVDPKVVAGHVNMLLVQTGGKNILIDAGCGNLFGPTTGKLPRSLARAGLKPSDISHIVISHIHPDHAGGLIDAEGKPTFTNAQVIVSETEYQFWTADKVEMPKAIAPPEMVQQLIGGAKKLVGGMKDRVAFKLDVTGLELIPAPGHTPGHSLVAIASEGQSLLHLADIVHMPQLQLANPTWQVVFDADPQAAADTRAKILDRVVADRMMISGAHIPFPAVGHVAKLNHQPGYTFVPATWQW